MYVHGVSTNSRTRPLMLDSLFSYVNEDTDVVKSERLAMELLGLVNKANRIEADTNMHDDLAMAYAFCAYVRKYCHEELGDVSAIPEVEAQQLYTKDSLNAMMGLNGSTPLSAYRKMAIYSGKEPTDTKSTLDKYIKDRINRGELTGYVDVMSFFGDTICGDN